MFAFRTLLLVQWLRLCTPSEGGPGSIPGQVIGSYIPELRIHVPQLKLSYATTKEPACGNKDPECHSQDSEQPKINIFN